MINIGNNKLIMSDERQDNAVSHLEEIINKTPFGKEKIRVMPDYHEGKGCVIGFTSTFSDVIIPNFVGVDIGCGVIAYNLGNVGNIDFPVFDKFVRERIPLGMHHQPNIKIFEKYVPINKIARKICGRNQDINNKLTNKEYAIYDVSKKCGVIMDFFRSSEFGNYGAYNKIESLGIKTLDKIIEKNDFTKKDIRLQIGTLGGNNHFCEVGIDEDKNYWIFIHSGSRNFGLKIANIFQNIARYYAEKFYINVPKDMEYLPMDFGGYEYLWYMNIAQTFAKINRLIILFEILEFFNKDYDKENFIESVHNYIDLEQKIIRKGAIKCMKGEKILIPLNMRDGTIIGQGNDNKKLQNWNFSMPHGAGRIMGRGEAKRKLSLVEFKREMKGIWSSCINEGTLDESPMAYKDKSVILDAVDNVLDIENVVKPIYNLKAEEKPRDKKWKK